MAIDASIPLRAGAAANAFAPRYDPVSRAANALAIRNMQDRHARDALIQNAFVTMPMGEGGELDLDTIKAVYLNAGDVRGALGVQGMQAAQAERARQADLDAGDRDLRRAQFDLARERFEAEKGRPNKLTEKIGALEAHLGRPLSEPELLKLGGGGSSVSVTNVMPSPVTKATRTKIEGKQLDTIETLGRLRQVRSSFKPEHLTLAGKWEGFGANAKEKLGFDLSPKESQQLKDFAKFRTDALGSVNRTINELAGAAVSESEAARILGELPDPGQGLMDGDGPSLFSSKLENAIRTSEHAMMRYSFALSKGLDPLTTGIDLSDVPALVQRRGEEIQAEVEARFPNAGPEVWDAEVDARLSREFGLR